MKTAERYFINANKTNDVNYNILLYNDYLTIMLVEVEVARRPDMPNDNMKNEPIVIVVDDPSRAGTNKTFDDTDSNLRTAVPEKRMASNKKLFISAAGIFVCYFYFGILQEKM